MFDREEALHVFEYDAWANDKMCDKLKGLSNVSPAVARQWAHLVGVQELWIARIAGEDTSKIVVWPTATLSDLEERLVRLRDRWKSCCRNLTPEILAQRVRFTNSAGTPCADPLEAILRQVVNHGTHHRAIIASTLRNEGIEPPVTDYIFWRRELAQRTRRDKHFVIEVTYTAPIEQIDERLAAHRAHLEKGYESGLLLASGPQKPRTGGVILARVTSREELDQFLAMDPFALANVATYRLTEFEPLKHQSWFASWVSGA